MHIITREHYDWWYNERINKNNEEIGWGGYKFPEAIGYEKRIESITLKNRKMKQLSELTGLYSLSKTLRFELKPIGKTLEHIESKGLIAQDEQRAEEYKKVKDIIDRYHKKFITMCLSDFKFEQNSL